MAKKEAKANKKENVKNKKSFSKDFKAELKKVVWPTPKQLVNNTAVVITIVLITAAIVFALDVIFESSNKFVVNQVDKVITATEQTNTTTEDNTASENNEGAENNENENSVVSETVAPEETTNNENAENNTTSEAE